MLQSVQEEHSLWDYSIDFCTEFFLISEAVVLRMQVQLYSSLAYFINYLKPVETRLLSP